MRKTSVAVLEASGKEAYGKSRVRKVHTQVDCMSDQVQVDEVAPAKLSP